ncbi:hypothetical protein PUN28_000116 [Cardiocondyla obscurior]|uniref:Uncharacterized protein n=1 Tax=Cardiocondyla obscurior TaxID=286306 RepID=A0AAW2GYA1_9HYME
MHHNFSRGKLLSLKKKKKNSARYLGIQELNERTCFSTHVTYVTLAAIVRGYHSPDVHRNEKEVLNLKDCTSPPLFFFFFLLVLRSRVCFLATDCE